MYKSIPVVWTNDDLLSMSLIYRCEFEHTLSLVDPTDKSRYPGQIGLYHYAGNDIKDKFGLQDKFDWLADQVYAVHAIPPGHLLPNHSDSYRMYCQTRNLADSDNIVRVIVFLQAWQQGHILQIDQKLFTGWAAGDWVSWTGGTQHLAANLGHVSRYTLQITGLRKKKI